MINKVLIVITLLFVTGCAQNPPVTTEVTDYRNQLNQLAELTDWEIRGRMSIQTAEEAFSASFRWRRIGDYQRIEITGMLGQSYATLEITDQQSSLSVQDDPPLVANDINQLMWQQLGFTIPVQLLTDWIKAYPTSSTQNTIRVNEDGFIERMSYQNWQVVYKKYRDYPNVNNLTLPSRTTVTNGRETIKLAIRTWQLL